MSTLRRLAVAVAVVTVAVATVSCGGNSVPLRSDWVGTWSGTYDFSSPDGSSATSSLALVIERQQGDLLWGYEEFVDKGQTIRIPLNGSATSDRRGFGLAATGLVFDAELTASDAVELQFFKTSEPATAFSVNLKLQGD